MSKILVIGWDGATFDLLKPWVRDGKLPNIARLMEHGVHGPLRSTLPPMTFPAWSSFMTGVNPGKHGIYDFTKQRAGTYDLEFVSGGQRCATSFWSLLSKAGRKVISVSVPGTYPPEPVNGVMISGFDAPGVDGPGATVDRRGMHPPEIYDEIQRELGGHPIGAHVVNEINSGRPDLAVERMIESVRRKAATVKHLMTNHPWDCCMILFGECDNACHQFWKYCDRESPLYSDNPGGMQDSLLRIFEELDRLAGELLDLVPSETTVMLMSDHGFGGVSDFVIYPNCWLREQGQLTFRGRSTHFVSRMIDGLKLRAVARLPIWFKRGLHRLTKRRLGRVEAYVRFSMIDWAGTQAYFDENPYYPGLWINLDGRQPKGTVSQGAEYEELRSRLIESLQQWRHPESGEPIVEAAYRREDVYSGPQLDLAPDIVVKWGTHCGYSYAFKVSSKSKALEWIEQLDPNTPQNLAFYSGKSGHHRDDGIFVASGPHIRDTETVSGAKIIDLAPTILHLSGVPVPDSMDGRVLEEIFSSDFTQEVQRSSGDTTTQTAAANDYSDADEAKISERLRALGYID